MAPHNELMQRRWERKCDEIWAIWPWTSFIVVYARYSLIGSGYHNITCRPRAANDERFTIRKR